MNWQEQHWTITDIREVLCDSWEWGNDQVTTMGSTHHLLHVLGALVAVPNKARIIDILLRNRWLVTFLDKQIANSNIIYTGMCYYFFKLSCDLWNWYDCVMPERAYQKAVSQTLINTNKSTINISREEGNTPVISLRYADHGYRKWFH